MRSNCVPRKQMERTVANFKPEFVFVNDVSLEHTTPICVHAVKLLLRYSNRAAAAVTVWPAKPKLFDIWPCTGKVC